MSKTQAIKIYRVFGKTDKGLVREENQDAYAYFESVNGAVFALCDGMGGITGGKQAAELALKEIEKFISEDWFDDEKKLLKDIFDYVNQKIREKLGMPEINVYPGTTLVLVLIRNNKVFYAHAGDSRIYYLTGKKIFLLTEDHSLVMKMLKEKKISANEAKNSEHKNVIYNALGIKEEVRVDICKKPISPADNDMIVLCSDGLTNELSDKEINEIINKHNDIEIAGNILIKKSLKKGGRDNVSVQLIRFYNTGRKTGNYKPAKKNKKKRLIKIAIISFLFLLISVWFMFNYVLKTNKEIPLEQQNENISQSKDLCLKKNTENTFYYSAGNFIYSYPGINNYTVIDILKLNNKKEFYFYPAEKIKLRIGYQ